MLHFLRERCNHDVKNIEMTTSGVHGANFEVCMAVTLKTRVTFAAVLGMAKCFPYELPSLSNTPNDLDPYAPKNALVRGCEEKTKSNVDLYGVGSQCNTSRVPLLSYPGNVEEQRSLRRHAMSTTHVVTGMLNTTRFDWMLFTSAICSYGN